MGRLAFMFGSIISEQIKHLAQPDLEAIAVRGGSFGVFVPAVDRVGDQHPRVYRRRLVFEGKFRTDVPFPLRVVLSLIVPLAFAVPLEEGFKVAPVVRTGRRRE